jgi:hypothetical protein
VLERGDTRVLDAQTDGSTGNFCFSTVRSARPQVEVKTSHDPVEALARELLGLGLLLVSNYELSDPVLDGELVRIELQMESGEPHRREFWCADTSEDPQIRERNAWVGRMLSSDSPIYPIQWRDFDASEEALRANDSRERVRRAEREWDHHVASWKAMETSNHLVALECPHCKWHGSAHRGIAPKSGVRGYFVCCRCSRSFSTASVARAEDSRE